MFFELWPFNEPERMLYVEWKGYASLPWEQRDREIFWQAFNLRSLQDHTRKASACNGNQQARITKKFY
ncbi:hypothetical protein WQ54_08135 [Bacillus sp. SA1-12]|nr:hypothetical protein WQ54_08135 [Bacillus sp. SA1-12]